MGASSSRKILCSSREPEESRTSTFWPVRSISPTDRLVRDKLRKEVQFVIRNEKEACDRIPIIQESLESVQQENV